MGPQGNIILYETEDGKSRIQLRADHGTVWLTQLEMAELIFSQNDNSPLFWTRPIKSWPSSQPS